MSDPLAEQEVKAIKTVDDCFEKVEGYNMESLKYPNQLKAQFPEFSDKLQKSLKDKAEKVKGAKTDDSNSIEIDGRRYWKSVFNGVMNYNRGMPGGGGGGAGGKPSGVTVYETINVGVHTPESIVQRLLEKPSADIFKKISFIDRNPGTGKHEFVVETYKISKYFPSSGTPQAQEEKK